jgi:Skp family chaperone for outer membrane proteins
MPLRVSQVTNKSVAAILILIAVITAVVAAVVYTRNGGTLAGAKHSTNVAVIDGEKLKATAKCFAVHEKIASKFSSVLARIRDAEGATKREYEAIKNNSALSQKQRAKEVSKIESRWTSESAKYNAEIQTIRNTDAKLTERIQQTVLETVKSIAKSSGIDVVVNKWSREMMSVFYNSSDVDITDLVIKKLDERLPEIHLEEVQKW